MTEYQRKLFDPHFKTKIKRYILLNTECVKPIFSGNMGNTRKIGLRQNKSNSGTLF